MKLSTNLSDQETQDFQTIRNLRRELDQIGREIHTHSTALAELEFVESVKVDALNDVERRLASALLSRIVNENSLIEGDKVYPRTLTRYNGDVIPSFYNITLDSLGVVQEIDAEGDVRVDFGDTQGDGCSNHEWFKPENLRLA